MPQHQPSQARTQSTVLRRGRPKLGTAAKPTKSAHKKLEDVIVHCTLAREASSTSVKVFLSKGPCQERRLADQICSSRHAGNPEVLCELRHARNPRDWTSTRGRVDSSVCRLEGGRSAAAVLRARDCVSLISFIKSHCVQWMNHMNNDVFAFMRDDVTPKCPRETRRHAGLQRPRPSVQPPVC